MKPDTLTHMNHVSAGFFAGLLIGMGLWTGWFALLAGCAVLLGNLGSPKNMSVTYARLLVWGRSILLAAVLFLALAGAP